MAYLTSFNAFNTKISLLLLLVLLLLLLLVLLLLLYSSNRRSLINDQSLALSNYAKLKQAPSIIQSFLFIVSVYFHLKNVIKDSNRVDSQVCKNKFNPKNENRLEV